VPTCNEIRKMKKITLIGDVHEKIPQYLDICKNNEFTIQLGDLSYDYRFFKDMSQNHRFIEGNHGNWDSVFKVPNFLGRFGYNSLNGIDFFFVSGGFSLDKAYRVEFERKTGVKTWFENEELSYKEGLECLEFYEEIKPDLVLTHEGPRSITDIMFDRNNLKYFGVDPETFTTSTSELLDQMLKIHTPKRWFFGHMHKSRILVKNKCTFQCLRELETKVIER
jgi:predicted phosphohydrolase